ncbi:MAG: M20/M25/M40 family metallo-hydrolase [Cyclobacteriaceae bacterium]
MKPALILLALIVAVSSGCAQPKEPDLIKAHINILASDEFEGRGTGSAGEEKAAKYIEQYFKKLNLKPLGENGSYRQHFSFRGGVHGTGKEGKAQNIIAFLDNGAENTVVFGAHFDHLGFGEEGNSLDANPKGKIHNGADDNASGVAGILELARRFSDKKKEANNFMFICFSGEELGLYGSKYWTEHPTIDLGKINYMINLDMVGRLDEKSGLSVSGSGTAPVWEPLLKELSKDKLLVKTDSSGTGPSDHTSFYLKNIPVLHFFTGSHSDYHKPSDDADKINAEGEVKILNLITDLVNSKTTADKLAFLPTKNRTTVARSAFKVTMGVMPSYSSNVEGLKVDGVSEGKPAQKAGITTGDIILKIGEIEVKDIQTYMDALGKFEKGQTVTVVLKRGEKVLTTPLTF